MLPYENNEKKLFSMMKNTQANIMETIGFLDTVFSQFQRCDNDVVKLISCLHEAYLSIYTKENNSLENKTSNLMLMTFGTGNQEISYKKMLKSIIKMPNIEKRNKFLKALRKYHISIFADLLAIFYYHKYKSKILNWDI